MSNWQSKESVVVSPHQKTAKFHFNISIAEDSSWEHVPTLTLPPSGSPRGPKQSCCTLEIDARNPPGDLITAAIRKGCKLTVPQLDSIISTKGIALPEKGTGHKGGLVEIDKATCLVKALFPDKSEEEQNRMIFGIMGRLPPVSSQECPEELLDIISQLDPENVQGFQQVNFYYI